MKTKSLSALAMLALTTSAFAGAEVRLTTQPLGGNSFLVEMLVNPSESLLLRGAQVDLRTSSSGLTLGADSNVDLDNTPNFWFDYTSAQGEYPALASAATGGYADFSNLQVGNPLSDFTPSAVYMGMTGGNGDQISLPAVQFTRLGGIVVTVPGPGTYTVDVLNLGQTDADGGATLSFGFGGPTSSDPFTVWSTLNGNIRYADGAGPAILSIVPEPTTLAILALGGLAAAVRRRKSA